MQLPATATFLAILSATSLTMAAPPTKPDAGIEKRATSARVQFELERQTTFIQRDFPVPGRTQVNINAVSATLVGITGGGTASCQAFNAGGGRVGGPIRQGRDTVFNGGQRTAIAAVQCT